MAIEAQTKGACLTLDTHTAGPPCEPQDGVATVTCGVVIRLELPT